MDDYEHPTVQRLRRVQPRYRVTGYDGAGRETFSVVVATIVGPGDARLLARARLVRTPEGNTAWLRTMRTDVEVFNPEG